MAENPYESPKTKLPEPDHDEPDHPLSTFLYAIGIVFIVAIVLPIFGVLVYRMIAAGG